MTDPRWCSINGCNGIAEKRGWCAKHYRRWQRHGDPLYEITWIDRLWAKVEKTDTCWLWRGPMNRQGYGIAWRGIRHSPPATGAHRAIYELMVGPIPNGLQLDHLCRVRHCVNPTHLEPVTPRENTLRSASFVAANAAKSHCKRGHAFTADNTYLFRGRRACRACRRYLYAIRPQERAA